MMKKIVVILILAIALPAVADHAVYRFRSGDEFYRTIETLREKYGYVGYSLMENPSKTKTGGYIEAWIETDTTTIEAMKKTITVPETVIDEKTKEEKTADKTLPITYLQDVTKDVVIEEPVEKTAEVTAIK